MLLHNMWFECVNDNTPMSTNGFMVAPTPSALQTVMRLDRWLWRKEGAKTKKKQKQNIFSDGEGWILVMRRESLHISDLLGGIVLLICTIFPLSFNGSDGNATIALSDMAKLQTMLALFHIWVIDLIPHCSPGDIFNVPTAKPRQV